MSNYNIDRRKFFKTAGLVSAGLSCSASSIFNLKNLGAMSTQHLSKNDGYKALVCIYLGGGADSFNMLVPRGISEYQEYKNTRTNLALERDSLLSIDPINVNGSQYGMHPMMPNVQQLFNQGKAAWLTNLGTLVRPVTQNEIFNGSANLPLGLYSHSDQSNQWMTALPSERSIKGWAGRISELMNDINIEQKISMNLSFAGSNIFQSANKNEFSLNESGAVTLNEYQSMYNPTFKKAVDKIVDHSYNEPMKQAYANLFRSSIDSSINFNEVVKKGPELMTSFSENSLSNQMKMMARTISVHEDLGFKRQIFFIDFGGWDTHDALLEDQNFLLARLDTAIGEFNKALIELGMEEDVVLFTMSEFARTLTSNGNGTDHAWGGNVFAVGGPVKGNRMYGTYPTLAIDSNIDLGSGSLIPSMANDLYFAELALWFGVPLSELHTIFPNLGNFYAQGSTQSPIGFLNI
jgi:uncharacterized protein (DUF1501 family)